MLKTRVLAIAAIVGLAAAALTGCSGKLTTEEACNFLVEKGNELEIKAVSEELISSVENSDSAGAKASAEKLKDWLLQGAGESADGDFKDALEFTASKMNDVVDARLDANSDSTLSAQETEALASEEHREVLRTSCPQIGEYLG
ncbi:hypothetical protein [Glutamicibacter sp. NPDC087344]|uniref:hypothetical protein n=1 Tax=Glutamicibacter sp. NPDC087344 TaxID=3363994 RepID=UPI00382F9426